MTKQRLIDIDKVKSKAITLEGLDGNGIPYDIMAVPVCTLEDIPTVDAVEVKYGHWDWYSSTMMECSICKRHTARHRFEYCPHCGAKMSLED